MESALLGFIETVTRSTSKDAVWEATRNFVNKIGYSDCSLTTAHYNANKRVKNPRTITSYSLEFKKAYEEGMGEIDPFLHFHCFDLSVKQILTKKFVSFPNASAAHQLFLDHVSANGGTGGIGVPVRTQDQGIFGGWVMSCAEPDNRIRLLAREYSGTVQLAALLAYERMVTLGLEKNDTSVLSERERECLLWLCMGLRVSMIADKLAISESAVNLYITNAKHKLGAKTREQAIARAILGGEIRP